MRQGSAEYMWLHKVGLSLAIVAYETGSDKLSSKIVRRVRTTDVGRSGLNMQADGHFGCFGC